MVKVLALDLGSRNVGWAVAELAAGGPAVSIASVEAICDGKRKEGEGFRWLRFRAFLDRLVAIAKFEAIVFEEVRRHSSTDAAHAYGAAKGVVVAFCAERGLPYSSVPIADVKRAATGKGGGPAASKGAVLAAAQAKWPHLQIVSEDAADAAWIAVAGAAQLG